MDKLIECIREGCPERGVPAPSLIEYDEIASTTTLKWLGVKLDIIERENVLDVFDPKENTTIVSVPTTDVNESNIIAVFPYLWERVAYHCSRPVPIPRKNRSRRNAVWKTV